MPHFLPPDPALVGYVARHMRDKDWHEIAGVCAGDVVAQCRLLATQALAGAVVADDRWSPVAAVFATPLTRGVCSATMFATDAWPTVALAMTRYIRREMLPRLWAQGVVRFEARSIESHHAAHRWMRALGGRCEARLPHHTPEGDTYLLFALTRFPPRRTSREKPHVLHAET